MLNKAQLIGNVGNDPEVKALKGEGKKVANFSIATSESYRDKDGNKQDKTEWHRIVCFDKVAEIVEKYVKKGSQIYVDGKIQTRDWTDKEGVKKYTTEILVQTIKLLGKKGNNDAISEETSAPATSASAGAKKTATAQTASKTSAPAVLVPTPDDDLPF